MLHYLESTEVCGIKVGICCKLNEYMETYMYQRSRTNNVTQISLNLNSFCPEGIGQTEVKLNKNLLKLASSE